MNAANHDPVNNSGAKYVRELQEAVSKSELELSECKQTAVENEKTVAFWNGILEESLAGIYVIDSGHFSYVNQSFADIFGYTSPTEIVGSLEFLELVAPESRADDDAVAISASIGISVFPRDGEEIEALLHQADSAMCKAKKSGKNTYRFASSA